MCRNYYIYGACTTVKVLTNSYIIAMTDKHLENANPTQMLPSYLHILQAVTLKKLAIKLLI